MPNVDISALPFMSTQEMLQSGMPLEVSRSMTLREIHSAFNKPISGREAGIITLSHAPLGASREANNPQWSEAELGVWID
jgi:hypothetical protein